ncbi:MAG: NERD domain-containing protein [Promethearchaeota archaeon]
MNKLDPISWIPHFFLEIYKKLTASEKEAIEIWCETYEINSLKDLDELEIHEVINNFEFISIQKGRYTQFYSINKILFIIEAIQILGFDIKKLSSLINYSGFEQLIEEIVMRNGYITIKNFRFSDKSYYRKKMQQTKYEIDVIGWKENYILLIDSKQWKKRNIYNALNKAANLQNQRVFILKKNPEILSDLIQSLIGKNCYLKIKLPLIMIPVIVTFEENWMLLNENLVPLVSIYKLNSFLQELKLNLSNFKVFKLNKLSIQKQII